MKTAHSENMSLYYIDKNADFPAI